MKQISKIQKLCEKITNHRIRKLYAWNERETEFYYRCKICGFRFWNNCRVGGKEMKDGNVIKTFNSVHDVKRLLGYDSSLIARACRLNNSLKKK